MSSDVRAQARPLQKADDLDRLLERVGDARVVLLGEASHGTHEYYAWRAEITKRLIEEKGFGFVAVEGDWPDCYEVNRSVRLHPDAPEDPRTVLDGFDRWPTWMWANEETVAFTRWLRAHNAARPEAERAGFYGLDVYSLWESLHSLLAWLQEHEPEHVPEALAALRCFEPFGEDPQHYALSLRFSPSSCQGAVADLLAGLQQERLQDQAVPGTDPEGRFSAEQNAAVALDAERYYRSMVGGSDASWNVRDTHMADTLDRLLAFHGRKAVVWEHNTHVGDARATDMAAAGMVNVGQLARERHPGEVVAVGFGSHRGSVIAADSWGAQMKRLPVPPARRGSLEALLHEQVGTNALFLVPERDQPDWMTQWLDHRAIGVVYAPSRERWGNYVPTVLGRRYDAFLYLDETSALQPLHLEPERSQEQDTWPYAV